MRALVMGSTGSGKSTFARGLAARIDAPHIELDALNWGPGWVNLSQTDPETFKTRAREAVAAEAWTSCGNYSVVRRIMLARATHLIWLDYSRPVIMRRVITRSLARALDGKELWEGAGNKEDVRAWLDKEHPIRWAWDTFDHRRATYEALFVLPELTAIAKHRIRRPREADPLMDRLVAEAFRI
jgi:adenylate kinase family enzyme